MVREKKTRKMRGAERRSRNWGAGGRLAWGAGGTEPENLQSDLSARLFVGEIWKRWSSKEKRN